MYAMRYIASGSMNMAVHSSGMFAPIDSTMSSMNMASSVMNGLPVTLLVNILKSSPMALLSLINTVAAMCLLPPH